MFSCTAACYIIKLFVFVFKRQKTRLQIRFMCPTNMCVKPDLLEINLKYLIVSSLGESNILQIMVKVVKGVRPDLGAVPRCRPSACTGFLSLMQHCWTTNPDARPSFQGNLCTSITNKMSTFFMITYKINMEHK